MVNYCENITCLNKGVCRPLFLHSKCECVYGYSGDLCEITATELIIHQMISKSFAYVAIIAMAIVAVFIIIMDVLKYCFGIDPACEEVEPVRQNKRAKRQKLYIQHCIYVNPLSRAKEQLCAAAQTEV